ncbi:MAG TPA: chromate transporter [Spirochaetia bacterium]|nr:chromate transporter [Spirochaetales bacterium]HRS65088.1 chromate transporter [Spirochaetia bacterium]HOT60189.1 chromate transporter [Spirochaetales bacterium]HPD80654.1 chromate transporter [Spirochaetales bacterium]HQK33603.1 chromate transporter [Spirochaetales bacterium]
MNIYFTILKLAFIFFKIGLVGFGGGWTIVGIMQTELVPNWLSLTDFQRLIPVAQATPGPIALNAATLIGLKYGGILGALIISIAVLLPPVLLILIISKISKKIAIKKQALDEALRTTSIALLIFTIWNLLPATFSVIPLIFIIVASLLSLFTAINPAWIIIGAGLLYALLPL